MRSSIFERDLAVIAIIARVPALRNAKIPSQEDKARRQVSAIMEIRCPQCHKFFAVESEGKELIGDEEAEGLHSTVKDKIEDAVDLANPLIRVPIPHEHEDEEEDKTYEFKYKCKHCGYEWTELKERDKEVKGKF